MDITPKTKLVEILDAYPELEEEVIKMAPPFKNLKNPVLRKTIGKLATLSKIAVIGKVDVWEIVNELRRRVGLDPLGDEMDPVSEPFQAETPSWVAGSPIHTVDGSDMLDRGEHPLNHVNQLMATLQPGQFILLKTTFAPLPMHEAMTKQGYKVFYREVSQDNHRTYIGK